MEPMTVTEPERAIAAQTGPDPGWPAPGARLTGRGRTITEADLVGFAAATGDWHPQHVDAAWAAESMFGERIAHGMAVLSYSVGLIGFDPERVTALRSLEAVRFKRPVRIGETISVEASVREVVGLEPPLALVTLDWVVRIDGGPAAIKARVAVIWRGDGREAAPVAEPGAAAAGDRGDEVDILYPGGLLL
jgi:acyl dehydratase